MTEDVIVGTPLLWAVTIVAVLVLVALDFVLTHRPHEVKMAEAVGWTIFYLTLPLLFGAWIWYTYGASPGLDFLTGFLVEKSLSVDNLFVFMLLLTSFAVPNEYRQRVLLFGVVGALVLRGVLIAVGAQMVERLSFAFLVFGAILLLTAIKTVKDAMADDEETIEVSEIGVVRFVRRFWPVTYQYHGTQMTVWQNGRRALTPLALVVLAILSTDVIFAVDSVPAVYGITSDPYLVFATNAFALLGLRALYFVLVGALGKLVHLGCGLAAILGFIGVKLVLHWAHGVWDWIPVVPTLASLGVIVGILVTVVITSLLATRNADGAAPTAGIPDQIG